MRKNHAKLILLIAAFAGSMISAEAQRRTNRRTSNTNQADTTKPQQQVNNNQAPTKFNPYGNTPIEMAPQVGGFSDTIKRSLRQDGALEKSINERTPLPYE